MSSLRARCSVVDFTRLLATAQRLITKNGRSVTFISLDETPPDPAKPWDGPTDPRATPSSTLVVDAVNVDAASAVRLGLVAESSDLLKRAESFLIVSAGANVDLKLFQQVLDEGVYWNIEGVNQLRPASITVVSFVGLRR